jgi:hypothetical protein
MADVYNNTATGKAIRVSKVTATLPQTTTAAKFTVSGGSVLICDIIGKVTTACHADANNMKLIANPTVGADVDLCATVNVASAAIGTTFHLTGTLTDAMVKVVSGAGQSQQEPIQVEPGTIDLSCDASKTGAIKWTLFYIPLETGAKIS